MTLDTHEYITTHNGAIVTVELDLTIPSYMNRLVAVWFDGVDVSPLLDKNTLTSLDMEAERALSGDNVGDFQPSRDAHKLGG